MTKTYTVHTRDADIYVEAVHPTYHGSIVKTPAILTYSPYSVLGRNGDANHWNPRGFTRIYADVIGTGNSAGCYDYGGLREQRTGHDVVEWIAAQPWSTGRVGMLGGSYDGTTQYATAITHPPHLTTIVPEAAIAHWYGYAYSGGMRYTDTAEELGHQGPTALSDEGVDTPLGFDFGLAIPPPTDVTSPDWRSRVLAKSTICDQVPHTIHGYSLDPTYDSFWQERDYLAGLTKVRIPVLVASNWGDWNVKQEEAWLAFHALPYAKNHKIIMGTRWEGHGVPAGPYPALLDRWFDQYLLRINTAVEREPRFQSQTADSARSLAFSVASPITPTAVYPAPGQALADNPAGGSSGWQSIPGSSESAQVSFAGGDNRSAWFESSPLAKALRIQGAPALDLDLTAFRERMDLTVSIVDLPGGQGSSSGFDPSSLVAVTRGWLDSAYRNGLDHPDPLPIADHTPVHIQLKPTDYTFEPGHRLALLITSGESEWVAPHPVQCGSSTRCLDAVITLGADTKLTLPVLTASRI